MDLGEDEERADLGPVQAKGLFEGLDGRFVIAGPELQQAAQQCKEPVLQFLRKHSHEDARRMFLKLAKRLRRTTEERDKVQETDLSIIVPAFVISELKEAFQIGFLLFVPFLVIDMVVSNILLAMGMFMLSPVTVSLPLKLLLFVLVDGWALITQGLVLGYT